MSEQVKMAGRNPKEMAETFREKFLEALTEEDMEAIFRKLIEKAKDGSVQAAKMVMGFVFGKQGPGGRYGYDGMSYEESTVAPEREVVKAGPVTVEEVFREPLTSEELRAAREEMQLTRGNILNGGRGLRGS